MSTPHVEVTYTYRTERQNRLEGWVRQDNTPVPTGWCWVMFVEGKRCAGGGPFETREAAEEHYAGFRQEYEQKWIVQEARYMWLKEQSQAAGLAPLTCMLLAETVLPVTTHLEEEEFRSLLLDVVMGVQEGSQILHRATQGGEANMEYLNELVNNLSRELARKVREKTRK